MKNGNNSPKVEGPDKGQRGLRWTKQESLTLVAAKRKELDKSLKGTARGIDASDVQWVTIFQYCKELGVERDASQWEVHIKNLPHEAMVKIEKSGSKSLVCS